MVLKSIRSLRKRRQQIQHVGSRKAVSSEQQHGRQDLLTTTAPALRHGRKRTSDSLRPSSPLGHVRRILIAGLQSPSRPARSASGSGPGSGSTKGWRAASADLSEPNGKVRPRSTVRWRSGGSPSKAPNSELSARNGAIRWRSDPAKRKIDCQSSPTAKRRASSCWAFSALIRRARLCEMSWNSSTRMWR